MGRPKKNLEAGLTAPLSDTEIKVYDSPIDKVNEDDFLRDLKQLREEMTPKMKIALVRPGAIFQQANEFAAGYDVKAFDLQVEDGYLKFMLGIKSELPKGWYAEVVHRSSNSKLDTILSNTKGTIDCDFRGEWQARLKIVKQPQVINTRLGDTSNPGIYIQSHIGTQPIHTWKEGEIALQVLFHKIPDFAVEIVEESELSDTQRGEGGFGSTGTGL